MNFTAFPNQQFRVDIVDASFTDWFGPDSSAGVLANIVPPVAEGFPVAGFNATTFDLTSWAGSTVRLAFRQADNLNNFQSGVDNVSITSSPTESVPEPSSILGLVALSAGGVGSLLKCKRKQNG